MILKLVLHEKMVYPLAQPQDYYKLLYQAAFGMEHIVPNASLFQSMLLDEIQTVEPDSSKPLLQNISIGHPISRINLAAAKHRGLHASDIARWSLESCRSFRQIDPLLFHDMIKDMMVILVTPEFAFIPRRLEEFCSTIKQSHYPPLHHSDVYRQAYSPHYRLLDPALIDIGVIND